MLTSDLNSQVNDLSDTAFLLVSILIAGRFVGSFPLKKGLLEILLSYKNQFECLKKDLTFRLADKKRRD